MGWASSSCSSRELLSSSELISLLESFSELFYDFKFKFVGVIPSSIYSSWRSLKKEVPRRCLATPPAENWGYNYGTVTGFLSLSFEEPLELDISLLLLRFLIIGEAIDPL